VMFRGDKRNEAVIAAALAGKRERDQIKPEISRTPADVAVDATKTKSSIRMGNGQSRPTAAICRKSQAARPSKIPTSNLIRGALPWGGSESIGG
jgi:hypothetical protein